jgi:hypothetical protein
MNNQNSNCNACFERICPLSILIFSLSVLLLPPQLKGQAQCLVVKCFRHTVDVRDTRTPESVLNDGVVAVQDPQHVGVTAVSRSAVRGPRSQVQSGRYEAVDRVAHVAVRVQGVCEVNATNQD